MDKNDILKRIENSKSTSELETVNVEVLGKSGSLSLALRELGKMSPDERKVRGAELNLIKQEIISAIENKKSIRSLTELKLSVNLLNFLFSQSKFFCFSDNLVSA